MPTRKASECPPQPPQAGTAWPTRPRVGSSIALNLRAGVSAFVDRLFGWLARAAALLTLALLAGILVSLVIGARPAIEKYGLGFLTHSVWDPVSDELRRRW